MDQQQMFSNMFEMAKHFEVMKQRQMAVQKFAHERAVQAMMQQAAQHAQPPSQSHNQAQQPKAEEAQQARLLKLEEETVDWYTQGGFPTSEQIAAIGRHYMKSSAKPNQLPSWWPTKK